MGTKFWFSPLWSIPKSFFTWHIRKNIYFFIDLMHSTISSLGFLYLCHWLSVLLPLILYVYLSHCIVMICLLFSTSTDFEFFDGKTCVWPSLLPGAWYRTWQKEKVLDSVTAEWICSLWVWPLLLTDAEPSSLTAEEFCTLHRPQFWNSGQVCEETLSPLDRNPHLDHIPLPQRSINNSGGNKLTFWTWAQVEESQSK